MILTIDVSLPDYLASNSRRSPYLIGGSVLLYALLFPFLYPIMDHLYFPLGLLPILAAGLLGGFRGAVHAVVAISVIHFVLLVGPLGNSPSTAFVESFPFFTLIIGGTVGYVKDLQDELGRHRDELAESTARLERDEEMRRKIGSMLVSLSDRDRIEQTFCELIARDGYPLVGISRTGAPEQGSLRALAGDLTDSGEPPAFVSMDDAPPSADSPADETVLIADTEVLDSAWARAAREEGIRALFVVPVSHNNLRYGVLVVGALVPNAFDTDDRDLLRDLADWIAYAIHDSERRESLRSDRPIEIRVSIDGSDSYLFDLAEHDELSEGARISVLDSGRTESGLVTQYLECAGTDLPTVTAAIDSIPDIDVVTVHRRSDDGSESAIEVRVPSRTLVDEFVEVGGAVRSMIVRPGGVSVVANFGRGIDLGSVIDELEDRFSKLTIESKSHIEPSHSVTGSGVLERLSDKQIEALLTAYARGFFDRPQDKTAEEIADVLGVSRTTFLKHVRTAEATLVDEFVENHAAVTPRDEPTTS